jgi:Arc/MetJ-type ribon-helix-helix transcriptional regulator
MKLSVSLPDEDVEFLDAYGRTQGIGSRSAVLHRAVRLLRATELTADYETAWQDWADSGEAAAWETTARDGMPTDAPR